MVISLQHYVNLKHDFDINDIEDVMGINKKQITDEDTTNMDNDSLESCEGVLESKRNKPSLSIHPINNQYNKSKSGGFVTALYLAQKQKFQQEQTIYRKRFFTV